MPCYKPLKAFLTPSGAVFQELGRHDILGDLELPCGRCIGCRMRRASDWELRCMHQAQGHDQNCFITLTYRDEDLPPHNSLNHRDFQLFVKRTRKKVNLTYYMCGEYGDETQRPHYHACIFNYDYPDRKYHGKSASGGKMYTSDLLAETWGLGNVTVQDLNNQTASYCTRYIMQKALGANALQAYQTIDPDTGEIIQRRPPYNAMSKGLGKAWLLKYGADVYNTDQVIARGSPRRPPKYYDRLLKSGLVQFDLDSIKQARIERAKLSASENTDERRRVREIVHEARVKNLKRTLT